MRRVAIGMDLGDFVGPELVLDRSGRRRRLGTPRQRGLECRGHVVDFQGDRLDAVTVPHQALGVG